MTDGAVLGEDGVRRCSWAATPGTMRDYHDTEWGLPVRDEQGLFERLCLEGFQAGLSWATILNKRDRFREVFHDFDVDRVAAMTDDDVVRLMGDVGIVRNRAKILATRKNAVATIALREDGGLAAYVESFRPERTPTPRTSAEVPMRLPAIRLSSLSPMIETPDEAIDSIRERRTSAEVPTVSAESTALSKALLKRGFGFVGPTTVHALMEATGLVDTHLMGCHRRGASGEWPE